MTVTRRRVGKETVAGRLSGGNGAAFARLPDLLQTARLRPHTVQTPCHSLPKCRLLAVRLSVDQRALRMGEPLFSNARIRELLAIVESARGPVSVEQFAREALPVELYPHLWEPNPPARRRRGWRPGGRARSCAGALIGRLRAMYMVWRPPGSFGVELTESGKEFLHRPPNAGPGPVAAARAPTQSGWSAAPPPAPFLPFGPAAAQPSSPFGSGPPIPTAPFQSAPFGSTQAPWPPPPIPPPYPPPPPWLWSWNGVAWVLVAPPTGSGWA